MAKWVIALAVDPRLRGDERVEGSRFIGAAKCGFSGLASMGALGLLG